jgi:membrane-bound metal-dependent hydrolase YbcI (DUF457 family)
MMATGHFVSGMFTGLAAAPVALQLAPGEMDPARAIAVSALFSFVVAVGALWPDIDHKPALISKVIPLLSPLICHVMMFASRLVYQATRTDKDRPTGCHRTLTHTLPFVALSGGGTAAILLATPSAGWAAFFGLAVALGTLTHIGGDALTLSGVPTMWPLLDNRGRRWSTHGMPRWVRFRAGGKFGEPAATWLFTALACVVGALTAISYGRPWWSPVADLIGGLS